MSIVASNRRKTPLQKKIDRLIGPVYGIKTANGCPRSYKNSTYVKQYNKLQHRFTAYFKPPVAAYAHGSNLKVSPTLDSKSTLVYLDFDTHTKGNSAHVKTLFDRLRHYFLALLDGTINARGGSNWLVVQTRECKGGNVWHSTTTDTEYNALIVEFQRRLQLLGADLDIEHIEVKGKVYERNEGNGQLLSVKCGDLLKCPTEDKYVDQKPITVEQLKAIVASLPVTPYAAPAATPVSPQSPKATKRKAGSFHARTLTDEQVANLDTLARKVDAWFKDRPTTAPGRHAITARRFAEIITTLCILEPNADGSNPYKRHEEFMNTMCDEGHFQHRYRHEVYKQVRDYLSHCGLLNWQDHTYSFGDDKSKGKACKFKAAQELIEAVVNVLDGLTKQPSTLITTSMRLNVYLVPVLAHSVGVLVFSTRQHEIERWVEEHSYAHAA
ncbi:Uncharacterized protein OS=Planctomyces brasiliensis (strain ATCC 49424 / DSM 5305 / JCM 21570 / NBRC 103401 / IFAM 1448) GN=Plabr_1122 PE=4 SV=1 [Gemmataceae bacterium]|nr:Uncharacterized protein OS=Planctomyces brasiliensis (strain ATCC 49424 / DSM 5305 / JCM 21570 / NBRC 103401 / IFAM 1448) GN=Plabr_1122 PE=4 SV=1 [Gemmataceae bacterium]VTU02419.1 Uncharacterized protein OS=Planctomyces brasiliensis (strain ATCC 49424 / DSM 5305 / JCM 21570 / NBRC 103401 / IFAM 1448) GN=Plabr_1122 PE=4 SV=1 [Gemmataceae bacterium]